MQRNLILMSVLALSVLGTARADHHGNSLADRLHQGWSVPRAADLVRDSALLTPAIQAVCAADGGENLVNEPKKYKTALAQARLLWGATLSSWESLSAVAFGPVLERRAQRQIDFTPTRPRMIAKAVKSEPANAAAMELIGTPAKGLPALEWLLWGQPIQPASAECRYAVQVAAEIEREASALQTAKVTSPDDAASLSELLNQWIAGLERLRWANMEMPVRVALTSNGRESPVFPRAASGASAASWAAQWGALRALASGPVSLESILRERHKTSVADALARAVSEADASMQGLATHDTSRILAAANQLAALKRLVESEVASALGVSIGFSDADGD